MNQTAPVAGATRATAERGARAHPAGLAPALVFLVAATVFAASPVRPAGDSHYSMLLSENVLRRGHFHLDEYFTPLPLEPSRYPTLNATGYPYQVEIVGRHVYYRYPPGSSLLSMPLVATMNAVGVSAVAPDGGYERRGEGLIQGAVATLLMAALAVVFFLTSRLLLPTGWSLLVTVGGAFGSQVWSAASRALWAHTWEILLLGLVVYMLAGEDRRGDRARPVQLATLLSWAYLVRPVGAIPLVAVSAYLLLFRRAALPRFVLTCAGWLTLFVGYSIYHFGQPLPSYYLTDSLRLDGLTAGLAGALLSPSRGLFVFEPILLFVAYLLTRYRRSLPAPRLVGLALAIIAAHVLVVSAWPMWWGGHSYGPRLFTDLVPWFVLLGIAGLKAMVDGQDPSGATPSARARPTLLAVGACLLVLSVAINAPGALVWETVRWNEHPVDVDQYPERFWDWQRPQFLAGLVR